MKTSSLLQRSPNITSCNGRASTSVILGLALFGLFDAESVAQAVTGFDKSDSGPYDYNDPANWVGGIINGKWHSSLVLTGHQTISFAADTPLPSGLSFGYDGNFNETLVGSGG